MREIIRKVLCTSCVFAVSSVLLCSCGAPSASPAHSGTPAPATAGAEEMALRETTDAPEQETSSAMPHSSEDVTPVSGMNVLCHPCGAAVMADGSLLVTDVYNRVIWHVADGESTVYAGSYSEEDPDTQPLGGYNDGSYADSLFRSPWAIAPFLDGWAVSDPDNHVVRLLQNGVVQTINAHTAGSGSAAAFEHPTGLAADEDRNLYVADTFADTIYKITPQGEIVTEVFGVSEPMGICWQDGSLYVAETGQNRVVSVKDGKITVVAGSGEAGRADGPAEEATFASPQGVAIGSDGTVYVADTDNSAIREIKDGNVSTLYARDVRDLGAFFPVTPIGMLNTGDDLYVCDPFARTLLLVPMRGL